jgi:hypothetical protein
MCISKNQKNWYFIKEKRMNLQKYKILFIAINAQFNL